MDFLMPCGVVIAWAMPKIMHWSFSYGCHYFSSFCQLPAWYYLFKLILKCGHAGKMVQGVYFIIQRKYAPFKDKHILMKISFDFRTSSLPFTFFSSFFYFSLFFKFYFIFKLYIIVLVLPNIKMNPPQVYPFFSFFSSWFLPSFKICISILNIILTDYYHSILTLSLHL